MKLAEYTLLTFAGVVAFVAAPGFSFGQDAAEPAEPAIPPEVQAAMDEEVQYVRALNQAQLPDLAADVIKKARVKWPLIAPRMEVLEQEGVLALGQFDKVKALIAKKPKGSPEYWALNLAMADAYYARNSMKECGEIYEAFFKAVPKPTPALKTFWLESSFKWAQMLLSQKREADATKIYDAMLATDLPETTWCLIASENCELLLRLASEIPADTKDKGKLGYRNDLLARAEKVIDKLLWKRELIIYFGRAVAMKAHVAVLRGQLEKAQDLVNDYMGDLSEIHNQLLEFDPDGSRGTLRLSPMPQCRFLLASILYKEAEAARAELDKAAGPKKAEITERIASALLGAKKGAKRSGSGAYNHAVNVYVKYPESPWAGQAGELMEKCCDMVQDVFGKDLRAATKIPPGQMKKVREMEFRGAIGAYSEGKLVDGVDGSKGAESLLIELLGKYPEIDESVGAAVTLSEAYGKLAQQAKEKNDKEFYLMAEAAVAGYVVDRFAGLKSQDAVRAAGEQVLRLAEQFRGTGREKLSKRLYTAYFANFNTHYLAAQTAFRMANSAFTAGDYETAADYYKLLVEYYPKSPNRAQAVKMIVACYSKLDDTPRLMEAYKALAGDASTSPFDRITAKIALANLQQKEGFRILKEIGDAEADAAAQTADAAEGDDAARPDNKKLKFAAAQNVIRAINTLQDVLKEIDAFAADPKSAREQKEKAAALRETAQFLIGDCWSRMKYPVGKITIEVIRAKTIAAFEAYLKAYPKGKWAAIVLSKIATIHTAAKDMEKAGEAMERLMRDFPDSDEAKNSVPRQAKNLMEMGLREEAAAQYRLMLAQQGAKYTVGQYLAAADVLLEARNWELARQAFDKVRELGEKDAKNATYYVTRAIIGSARAFYGAGRYDDAHKKLEDFLSNDAYQKSSLVGDANELMMKVASDMGAREKDDERRRLLFNEAVGAVKKLRSFNTVRLNKLKAIPADQRKPEDVEAIRAAMLQDAAYDLENSRIMFNKAKAEEDMNLREQADETRRKSVAGGLAFLMSHEPDDDKPTGADGKPAHPFAGMSTAEKKLLEEGYGIILPELAKLGADFAADVRVNGEAYLKYFPAGPHRKDVENALNRANAFSQQ